MEVFKGVISGYGYDGEGVARLDGKVVFLPYALEGEEVEFSKLEEKKGFIKAKLQRVLKENENRCKPPCPYFGRCGGCALQHAKREHQLQIKKNLLISQLKKVGFDGEVEVVASPVDFGYRNKIKLFVGRQGLSLKERGSGKLVAISKCLLVGERINDAISKINNFIKLQNLYNFYQEVVLREENGKLLIGFVVKEGRKIDYQGLYLVLGGECGIFEIFNKQCVHKVGLKCLKVNEMGLDCEFSILSFHQVNAFLTEKLYKGVIENVIGQRVINCYSGAGVLSGVLALQGKDVIGIELGESEHADAEKLKKDNNLSNLTNICGDCSDVLANFEEKADTIIVDPPRAGLSERVCETINSFDCKRLVYVSCNSATLVRDLGRLNGFFIDKVAVYDMFAQTGEYEVLCILNRL